MISNKEIPLAEKIYRQKQGWASRAARGQREKATKGELTLRRKLCDAGFNRHRFQQIFILKKEDKIYITDFFIRRKRIIIEVDGGYHTNEDQIVKDAERDKLLLGSDMVNGILRLTNEQVFALKWEEIKRIIDGMTYKECLYLY